MIQESNHEDTHGMFYTKKEPRKSFSTYMRNQNKLYVNSLNVIDRKAAIMIRVNATIISGIVIFFEHIQGIPQGLTIGLVMVIASFISLLTALSASRPNTFSVMKRHKNTIFKKYPNIEENIFLVGLYDNISLQEYEAAYDKLIKSQELQVGNQIRTMYLFERQLKRAFILIEIAYGSFIIGFIIVVLTFIISNLTNQ